MNRLLKLRQSHIEETKSACVRAYLFVDHYSKCCTVKYCIILFSEPVNCDGEPNWVEYTEYAIEGRSPGDRAVYVCMVGVKVCRWHHHSVRCLPAGWIVGTTVGGSGM